jgi:hypothetical protein
MTTVAIVGAGRGLGAAARGQEHVDELAAQLTAEGITARGYAGDVRDPASTPEHPNRRRRPTQQRTRRDP